MVCAVAEELGCAFAEQLGYINLLKKALYVVKLTGNLIMDCSREGLHATV